MGTAHIEPTAGCGRECPVERGRRHFRHSARVVPRSGRRRPSATLGWPAVDTGGSARSRAGSRRRVRSHRAARAAGIVCRAHRQSSATTAGRSDPAPADRGAGATRSRATARRPATPGPVRSRIPAPADRASRWAGRAGIPASSSRASRWPGRAGLPASSSRASLGRAAGGSDSTGRAPRSPDGPASIPAGQPASESTIRPRIAARMVQPAGPDPATGSQLAARHG